MSRKDREATEDKLKLLILKVQEKKNSSYINQMQVCLKRVKYKFSKDIVLCIRLNVIHLLCKVLMLLVVNIHTAAIIHYSQRQWNRRPHQSRLNS